MRGKSRWKIAVIGLAAGILNGLFGSGGGTVAVPLLKKSGLSAKEAHATSVAMMLVLSAVSAFLYLRSERLSAAEVLPFLPAGIIGAVLGSIFFKRIPVKLLKKIFGGFIVFAAARILISRFF